MTSHCLRTLLGLTVSLTLLACGQTASTAPDTDLGTRTPAMTQPGTATRTPGTLDPSFGTAGKVDTTGRGGPIGVLADGTIVLARLDRSGDAPPRPTATVLYRLNRDGRPDPTRPGGVTLPAADVVSLTPEGQVLLALTTGEPTANRTLTLSRHDLQGRPDPTFGTNGTVTVPLGVSQPAVTVLIHEPGGGVTFASGQRLHRLTANGQPDPTFGQNGTVTVRNPKPVATPPTGTEAFVRLIDAVRRPDGTYAAYGVYNGTETGDPYANEDFLAILTPGGHPLGGKGSSHEPGSRFVMANDVDVLTDGSLATSSYTDRLSRIQGFMLGATTRTYTTEELPPPVVLRADRDRRLLVFVQNPNDSRTLYRFDAAGQPDPTFGTAGRLTVDFDIHDVLVLNDGHLLVAGDGILARYFD